ncbi:Fe-S cluster assembly protein SufD [Spirochaeta africana]|uniref:FeS assembly protein SufD n=1 Tax=Spirochaeta africana (strain ATCC 700263 / DSM 8902 / Z-7692) TaxID=889378 RepID=H9UJR3_SPIAZ|nr:Fe-S cluster assembly protein SufD [Spirochaeta africana]AFG37756.1 FeS assembly protein SufD [Spirochaeta africana DSM 8902]
MSTTDVTRYTGTQQLREFVQAIRNEPVWLSELRLQAVEGFEKTEWPDSSADEEWRRSDIGFIDWDGLQYQLPPVPPQPPEVTEAGAAAPAAALAEMSGPAVPLQDLSGYVAYLNGDPVTVSLDPELAERGVCLYTLEDIRRGCLTDAQAGAVAASMRESLAAADARPQFWHYALLDAMTVVVLPRFAEVQAPFLIDHLLSGEDVIRAPHVVVVTEDGARATVVERFRSADAEDATVVSHGIDGFSAQTAAIDYAMVQDLNRETVMLRFGRMDVHQEARMHHFEAHFGGDFVKGRIEADMHAAGTDVVLNGVYFASDEQHFDLRTVQRHIGRNANSQTFYKGAARDEAHSIYQGLIEVKPGAALTDAYLTNNNLVLNDGARAESIPTLEIKNNDVKCSHGSTTGKIEPSYLFYLESRGFDPVEAKALLVEGFFDEVASQAPEFVQEQLRALVMDRLQME